MSRALTSEVNNLKSVKEKIEDIEQKFTCQTNTEDVINNMAEMMKGAGFKSEGGGQKPVSEHKAIQQLRNVTGDRTKFREWNEKFLNALSQVNMKNRKA